VVAVGFSLSTTSIVPTMETTETSSVKAYAPGSVTTIFAPSTDPQSGSLGVSFTIEDGIDATVEPSSDTTIVLEGEPTSFEPVERVLRRLNVTAEVSLTSDIPVGYGFGASGAATLATALAANEVFNLGQTREELIEAAHHAEVEAGTGLGDVFVQASGGLVWNSGDGVKQIDCTAHIEYTALDGIATSEVLGNDRTLERVRDLGQNSLSQFSPSGSLRELLDLSWLFAEQTGLATDRVVNEVQRVKQAGGVASMAMLGETVIATGVQDTLEQRTRITTQNAHVL
jgi:pantoate kinase